MLPLISFLLKQIKYDNDPQNDFENNNGGRGREPYRHMNPGAKFDHRAFLTTYLDQVSVETSQWSK